MRPPIIQLLNTRMNKPKSPMIGHSTILPQEPPDVNSTYVLLIGPRNYGKIVSRVMSKCGLSWDSTSVLYLSMTPYDRMGTMTDEQAIAYLQGIALTAVTLQKYVGELYPEEKDSLGQIDSDLTSLLDWHEEYSTRPPKE